MCFAAQSLNTALSPSGGLFPHSSGAGQRRARNNRSPIVPLFRLATLGLCALTIAVPTRAHDPSESWANAIVQPQELELVVTMAQITALRLIDPELKARALTADNFLVHRPRLEHEAIALFALTTGEKPL